MALSVWPTGVLARDRIWTDINANHGILTGILGNNKLCGTPAVDIFKRTYIIFIQEYGILTIANVVGYQIRRTKRSVTLVTTAITGSNGKIGKTGVIVGII